MHGNSRRSNNDALAMLVLPDAMKPNTGIDDCSIVVAVVVLIAAALALLLVV
jgi:hypothetical protein